MIRFENVSFAYEKGKPVLSSVSFCVQTGEAIGLIGANGAGKSTIMKLLLGLEAPDSGTVSVDDVPVSPKTLPQIRRKLGYVLQNSDHQMFMPTVYEDMIFGLRNYGMSEPDADQRVNAVLETLQLSSLKHAYNHQLSGGEKRMAAIATILAMEPQVILMDEPSSALDPFNRRVIINTIRDLPQTKIITSHDLDMIYDTCHRVMVISRGRITADGPAETILHDRRLLEENHLELPLRFQN